MEKLQLKCLSILLAHVGDIRFAAIKKESVPFKSRLNKQKMNFKIRSGAVIERNIKSSFKVGAGLLLLSASQLAVSDADIGVQPSGTPVTAQTNVDLRVIVPEILIFGVGETGDSIAQISWTLDNAAGAAVGNDTTYSGSAAPFTAPETFATTATAAIGTNGGSGSSAATNVATLPVFLFSNNGSDVTITANIEGGVGGGGTADVLTNPSATNTIPIADFTASQSGSILHPDISQGSGETADTAASSGIVNLSGSWTYSYTPSLSAPVAGTYSGRVTYVAAQP